MSLGSFSIELAGSPGMVGYAAESGNAHSIGAGVETAYMLTLQDVDTLIDGIAGVTLTALAGLPARCAPRGDLATRRSIERVVFEVRTEMAKVCQEMADKCGEPALDDDA